MSGLFQRYRKMQEYVDWTEADGIRVQSAKPILEPYLPNLIEDFYREIQRHPETVAILTGGAAQVARLKSTLHEWLQQLLTGPYDESYVQKRWQVGGRHVEIGLDQVFTNMALSRLRTGMHKLLCQHWPDSRVPLTDVFISLNKLLDLDLAIIEDAYQSAFRDRLEQSEEQKRELIKRQGEMAFRTLIEAAPCLIVMLTPRKRVSYFSQFAEQISQVPADKAMGKSFVNTFIPTEKQTQFDDMLDRVILNEPITEQEFPLQSSSGETRWMLWNARTLALPEGQWTILLVGQDISGLRLAQEKALQAERLAAIGQMMAGLAHESGNSLARSQMCLEMLKDEVPDNPEVTNLVGTIQKAQTQLRHLYEEVRNYAAPMKLDTDEWDIRLIWRQVWSNTEPVRQGRDTRLIEECEDSPLVCELDPFRMEQVFRNLFENSLAFCNDPVEVTIRCHSSESDGEPTVLISVQDNGPGISEEQRPKIFEPFYTTRPQGTGLGMAIVKRIVEAHGGKVYVQPSEAGANIVLILKRAVGSSV